MARYPEAVLQYAWLSRQFDAEDLLTTDEQPVEIIRPGVQNPDQGPDFLQAHIRIGSVDWHGHVEIHVDGNDWFAHEHHTDPNYNNVILHVVDTLGKRVPQRADGSWIPEISLGDRLNPHFLERYDFLMQNDASIACSSLVNAVPGPVRLQALEKAGWERMISRIETFEEALRGLGYLWEELIWVQLMGALGGKVNKLSFQEIAHRLPYRVLSRYREQPQQLEALLLGTAGLLQQPALDDEPYVLRLREDWQHLSRKHAIDPLQPDQVKYGRLRPANFPDLRLAQAAAFVQLMPGLLQLTAEVEQIPEQAKLVLPTDYWLTHYRLGRPSKKRMKPVGKSFLNNLMINCFVPMAFLYYKTLDRPAEMQRVFELLQSLPKESNRITRQYDELGFGMASAYDTQAAIELHRHYCQPRRCVDCPIGQHIFGQ